MPQDMPVLPAGNRGMGKRGLGRVAQNETLIRGGGRGMVVDIRIDIGRREGMTRRGRPHECGHYERRWFIRKVRSWWLVLGKYGFLFSVSNCLEPREEPCSLAKKG